MADFTLYISTKNGVSIGSAAVNGVTPPVASAQLPDLILGDAPQVTIYLVDGDGGYDVRSGNAGYTPRLALSVPGLAPTGGTFILGYGSQTSGTLTSGKRYKIISFASGDSFTNVGASANATGVVFTASGTIPTTWTHASQLTEVTTDLSYSISETDLQTALNNLATITTAGGVLVDGEAPVWLIEFVVAGARTTIYGDGTDLLPDGQTTVSSVQTGTSSVKERQSLVLARQPLALQGTFTPITNGWRGVLDCRTYALRQYLGQLPLKSASEGQVLEFELTDNSTGYPTTMLQAQVGVRNEVIRPNIFLPTPYSSYQTTQESYAAFVTNASAITGLTGGGAGNLDGIATTSLTTYLAAVVLSGSIAFYRLEGSTDAESSPDVIRPDDYDGATNAKVWRLAAVNPISLASGNMRITSNGYEIKDDSTLAWKQLRLAAGQFFSV